jgi:hypothetical protein
MHSLLWAVVAVLVVLWLVGVVARIGGKVIHLLLVGAVILFVISMLR